MSLVTTMIFNCEQVTARLTDYSEGAMSPLDRLRLRVHLAICPACMTMFRTLRAMPRLLRAILSDEPVTPAPAQALSGALATIRAGSPAQGRTPTVETHGPALGETSPDPP